MATTTNQSSNLPLSQQPVQFSLQSKNSVYCYSLNETGNANEAFKIENANDFCYSQNGLTIATVDNKGINVYNTIDFSLISRIELPRPVYIALSPRGSYLLTWQSSPRDVQNFDNLTLWNVATRTKLLGHPLRSYNKELWPHFKWSFDEQVCSRIILNQIQFFSDSFETPIRTLNIQGVQSIVFAPRSSLFAVFVPEKSNKPATVSIYDYSNLETPRSDKSFFKAQNAELKWNSLGTHLLVVSHTDVDDSGRSYYGVDGLYLLETNGQNQNVVLDKEGPIHDCSWSPSGKQFIVSFGFMPAKICIFNSKGAIQHEVGTFARNYTTWSPYGDMLCIAGFGNLSGDIDFWDPKKICKYATANSHCAAFCQWSPDSKFILTAVLSPRIRIDNCFKVFTYCGKIIQKLQFDEMTKIEWRPTTMKCFPRCDFGLDALATEHAQKAAPAVYRHPNFNSANQTTSISTTTYSKSTPKKAASKQVPNDIPGYAPVKKKKGKKAGQNEGTRQPRVLNEKDELQKQIRLLNDRIKGIEQLKQLDTAGEILSDAQNQKIASEVKLRKQLAGLQQQFARS
eukprot:TRINITY_DN1737_c0_g1_i1.p1 TRINITY_DN1737_c0_g1~~TRINITY_DN1737_c0_g1_i1.p1  ORF type:complete len:598 (-),score=218.52 TRINITY_DN1737_c0_g1_i1:142-1845(-)